MVDLSALMATSDFAREMRTRVKLDTQGLLELSVSYEVEDARNPLPFRAAPCSPLQPRAAPCSPVQPLASSYNVRVTAPPQPP